MFASTQLSLKFKVPAVASEALAGRPAGLSSSKQVSFSARLSAMLGLLRGSSLLAVAGDLLFWRTLDARHSPPFIGLKFKVQSLKFLRTAAIALLFLFLPSVLLAQPLPAEGPAGLAPMPDSGWLVALGQKEPWITTIIALMGALRLLLKPIFAAWHAFALATGNERFEAMAVRIAASRGLRVFAFVLDWFASVKLVPPVKVLTDGHREMPPEGGVPAPAPVTVPISINSSKTPNTQP